MRKDVNQTAINSGSRSKIMDSGSPRRFQDVFWLGIFLLHVGGVGVALTVLGLNRFRKTDRFNIEQYTSGHRRGKGQTEDFWPMYALAAGVSALLGWLWLVLLDSCAALVMKFSVHILTTYLAVISVICFWCDHFLWGVAFAVSAAVQFLYVISVIDRLPFTMLVLRKAVAMVCTLPEVTRVTYAFMFLMLVWTGEWTFGASGVVASTAGDSGRSWLLLVLSVSLFWTGAVLCNTVHVIVSASVFRVITHENKGGYLMSTLKHASTTSFGSICYGSLFTAAIRTLRWQIRGVRSKIGRNECLLCCVDFLFNLVETLVRFFNKYAYVQLSVDGKGFNASARDTWELFQSTGVEALLAYDCSGAVLLMITLLGGLIAGTGAGIWAHEKQNDKTIIVGCSAMLVGMMVMGVAVVVVESAVTCIYVCFAEDPMLIRRWDIEFFEQLSEMLHQRLQYRSCRGRDERVRVPESL